MNADGPGLSAVPGVDSAKEPAWRPEQDRLFLFRSDGGPPSVKAAGLFSGRGKSPLTLGVGRDSPDSGEDNDAHGRQCGPVNDGGKDGGHETFAHIELVTGGGDRTSPCLRRR